ncbi:MAG: M23 family metallopeptidase, partial [Rhodanobacter sp.]
MQIILVSRFRKLPRTLDLADRRVRLKLCSVVAMAVLGCIATGAVLALVVASPQQQALAEINELQQQIQQQDTQLASVRQDARRGLDALAMKLGQLQAQSTRLNALGERLVQVGKLDGGEFDFDQQPAVGGVEDSIDGGYGLPQPLDDSISQLASQFDTQQAQLAALQSLLLDAKIESSLKPTGMPVQGGYISSYFGGRADPFDGHHSRHSGIDIAVPMGTPVHAVAAGMVTFAGVRNGYGNVVEVDHGNGYMTRYAHNSKLMVKRGDTVARG